MIRDRRGHAAKLTVITNTITSWKHKPETMTSADVLHVVILIIALPEPEDDGSKIQMIADTLRTWQWLKG